MAVHRAVRLHGKQDLRLETVPVPEPDENYVLLEMSTVGLCRTDVHLFDEGQLDHIVIKEPITLGHETSGTVSKLGPGVTSLAVGDRVAVDPCRTCVTCRYCRGGRGNLCENMREAGVMQVDGGFATFMTAPADRCYRLPENVSLEEGALIEPLSVAVYGVKRARMVPGDAVVVFGAGPIGLFTMQSAKAYGAGRVLMVDINETRLVLASKLGADVTLKPRSPMSDPQALGEELKSALGGAADVCFECSGGKGTVDAAIHTCRPGGKVLMLGFGEMAMHVHLGMAAFREIDVLGAFASIGSFPECVELVSSGKVDVKSVISHRLPLDKVKVGMDLIRRGESIKVVINCQA
ncbi:sorbitol dehydrogenase-like [Physella acuta]|uniref:sorbitol dehydrogenase-like n=1 Tax=Physella acuta TaxID=109671 RepID=UPI0027DC6945|nr:sorbitol dehydrogenase-like [Physella acuta]